ncbi:MAG: hypothetical protein JW833_09200 [Prolixibacteraceae bacterium]|nr:hypothetical protein [Prolixibacteraceae bacterium]
MKTRLKLKIMTGFFLLASLLLIAGAISISEFTKLSKSVNSLIEDNYKTINAAQAMLESLEREDSGILMLMLGQWEEGRIIIESADSSFMLALNIAEGNQTEKDEDIYVAAIKESYSKYRDKWKKPIVNTEKEGNIDWYRNNIHKAFLETKHNVTNLMNLNQESMHAEAYDLKEESRRAIMPGIVAIIAAFIFSILLNFFISKYIISPIGNLSEAIKEYNPGQANISVVKSSDELKKLESEINAFLERLIRDSRK